MSIQLSGQFIPLAIALYSLAIISPHQPAQAQQTVIDTLPPPDIQVVPDSQQPLPEPLPQIQPVQIEPSQSNPLLYPSPENQEQLNPVLSQPGEPNQYSQNFSRYFVYVNGSNSQTLQRIRQVEPSAYIRQYQGRSIIQSGVFNSPSNAQQRVRQLAASGIYDARVVSFSNGQEIQSFNGGGNYYPGNDPYYDNGNNTYYDNRNNTYSQNRNNRYYVVIPGRRQDLPAIADRIIRNVGDRSLIQQRQQPLGPHVAVGPFPERSDADRWNKYIRDLGYGNARVYYR